MTKKKQRKSQFVETKERGEVGIIGNVELHDISLDTETGPGGGRITHIDGKPVETKTKEADPHMWPDNTFDGRGGN